MSVLRNRVLLFLFLVGGLSLLSTDAIVENPFVSVIEATCCRDRGRLGPVGSYTTIAGEVRTPDGVARSGAEVTAVLVGNPSTATCTYADDKAASGCAEDMMGGEHDAGHPYYSLPTSTIAPNQSKDGVLAETVTIYLEAHYTDPNTGDVYYGGGEVEVDPADFDQTKVLRIDIEVRTGEAADGFNNENWPLENLNGVSISDGNASLLPQDGQDANVEVSSIVTDTQSVELVPAEGSTLTSGMRFFDMANFPQFRPNGTPQPNFCVHPSGDDVRNCSCNTGGYCKSLQRAINVAQPGDVIGIAGGTYLYDEMQTVSEGLKSMVYVSKDLTIVGGWDDEFATNDPNTNPTILDAQQKARVMYVGITAQTTIDGIYFVNGLTTRSGGGFYIQGSSGLTITNSIISGNETSVQISSPEVGGAGIFIYASRNVTILNTLIRDNITRANGGGINLHETQDTYLENVDLLGNTSIYDGGGMYAMDDDTIDGIDGAPTLIEVSLTNNVARNGGGAYIRDSKGLQIEDVLVQGNNNAGLVITSIDNVVVDNVLVFENQDSTAFHISNAAQVQLSNLSIISNTTSTTSPIAYVITNDVRANNLLLRENIGQGISLHTSNSHFNTITSMEGTFSAAGSGITLIGDNNTFTNTLSIKNKLTASNSTDYSAGLYIDGDQNDFLGTLVSNNEVVNGSPYNAIGGILVLGDNSSFRDLLIIDNKSPTGDGGIRHQGAGASFDNLQILQNTGKDTIAYFPSSNNLQIDGFLIDGNVSEDRMLFLDSDQLVMSHGIIRRNTSNSTIENGIAVQGSNFTLENIVIIDNEGAENSTAVSLTGNGDVSHLTVANSANGRGDGVRIANGTTNLRNTIVANTKVGLRANNNTLNVYHSNIWNNETTYNSASTGNVNAVAGNVGCDPLFVDPTNGNYNLSQDVRFPKCVIDQGMVIEGADTDYEGAFRPIGLPDIGADEYGSAPPRSDGFAISKVISPTEGVNSWVGLILTADLPPDTGGTITLLDHEGVPIFGFIERHLQDGLTIFDLRDLDVASYPTLQVKLALYASNTPNTPRITDWRLSWLGRATESTNYVTNGLFSVGNTLLPNVAVQLMADGAMVAETVTDRSGRYEFRDLEVDPQKGYTVVGTLEDGQGETPRYRYCYDLAAGSSCTVPTATSPAIVYPTGSSFVNRNQNFDLADAQASYTTNIGTRIHLADLGYSFADMAPAADLVSETLGESLPTLNIHMFADGADLSRVYYDDPNNKVVIGRYRSSGSIGNRPMNREWHEYIHFVHDHTAGFPASTCGDSVNHGGYSNCGTPDSLIEAMAIFMASVIADKSGVTNPELYRMGINNRVGYVSLETNWLVWNKSCSRSWCPSKEEFAIAGVLWDLYDTTARDETVQVDINQLWTIVSDPNIENVLDLYEAFRDAGIGQIDGRADSCGLTALDEIFVMHGVFADLDGDRRFSCDEEVGRAADAGRPNRAAVPFTPQYIEVDANWSGTEPLPVLVTVTFPNDPSLNYSYETEAIDGLIIVEPLPEESGAQIKVTVENDDYISTNPLIIDNTAYLELLENASGEESIIESHEFVVAERPEPQVETIEIPMYPGWMLISPFLVLEDGSPEVVFDSIAGKYDRAYTYNGCDSADPWKQFNPTGPAVRNDLVSISHTQGVWVLMNQSATLTISGTVPTDTAIQLCAGANLVGYPLDTSQPVESGIASIASSVDFVYSYATTDPQGDVWKLFRPSNPAIRNDLETLSPYSGYWIVVDQNLTWTPTD